MYSVPREGGIPYKRDTSGRRKVEKNKQTKKTKKYWMLERD